MSDKPYPEGVTKVLAALARLEVLVTTIQTLQPAAEKVCAKLQAAREEHRLLVINVGELLESMDLKSTGNMGFGGRIGWFLAEMRRQLIADITAGKEAQTEEGATFLRDGHDG